MKRHASEGAAQRVGSNTPIERESASPDDQPDVMVIHDDVSMVVHTTPQQQQQQQQQQKPLSAKMSVPPAVRQTSITSDNSTKSLTKAATSTGTDHGGNTGIEVVNEQIVKRESSKQIR